MSNASQNAVNLAVQALYYRYGYNPALEDISLTMTEGELVALVGRNGAGKSTLLRCIAGWTRPTQGNILLQDQDIYQNERWVRQHIVLIPDTPPFYEALTAWEHAQMVAQLHRLTNWESEAETLFVRFGLWSNRDAFPFMYSRGMRYKLALCLALLLKPMLLLLDEPLGPLDPLSAGYLWQEFGRYQKQSMSILFSSHQIPHAVQPDRYLVMEQGRLLCQGTPDELQEALVLGDNFSLNDLLETAVANLHTSLPSTTETLPDDA
jgi:ABC-2 type transport system ATP-binding protein